MKAVIFGATGKIGCYMIDYFLKENPEMEIIAVGRRKKNIFNQKQVEYFSCDVEDASQFSSLPDSADAIIDLAGAVTTRVKSDDVHQYVNSNIIGAVNIFDYAAKIGVDRVLYAQTYNDVFADPESGTVIYPDARRKRKYTGEAALYAITKNAAVDLLEFYSEKKGFKSFVFRLPSVYSYTPSPYYLVNGEKRLRPFRKMIQQAIDGEPIEIWGNPDHVMDMVYIKDCCQIFYKGLIADCEGGTFNVGTGVGTTLQQQVEGMIEVFSSDQKSEIIYRPEKPNGKPFIMDISNGVRELGYKPQYDYVAMLKDMKLEMNAKREEFKNIL
ncbi:MAG: NAD-dependent epimerase/dehydratase family protein [Lachnospiraceae bacterium]|jgi:UDP-glucose 4-epimerase